MNKTAPSSSALGYRAEGSSTNALSQHGHVAEVDPASFKNKSLLTAFTSLRLLLWTNERTKRILSDAAL